MWKLGLWPRNSFSGNIYLEFSELSLQCIQQGLDPDPLKITLYDFGYDFRIRDQDSTIRTPMFTKILEPNNIERHFLMTLDASPENLQI
jgi:hypothetical protein